MSHAYAYGVFVLGLLLTAFYAFQLKQKLDAEEEAQFSLACNEIMVKLQERLGAYALILRGGAGLFAAAGFVDRASWRLYVEKLRAGGSVPGVQGIGFVEAIPAAQLAVHVARVRAEGFPDYTVHPLGERPLYTSIVYLEPFRGRNLRAFGYDMFSEPVRRAAMAQARDTGDSALSGKVHLMQETASDVQAGTLMYHPVYRQGLPLATPTQRRAALIGWVYMPYRMNDLMTGILQDWTQQPGIIANLHIYDGLQATPGQLMFDSRVGGDSGGPPLSRQVRQIDFNGRPWLLVFERHTASVFSPGYASVHWVLTGGLVLNGLLLGLLLLGAQRREEHRRLDRLLAEQQALLENQLIGLATLRDGRITWANPALERIFGYERGEMVGMPARCFHPHDENHAEVQALAGAALAQGGSFRTQQPLVRRDGTPIWVDMSGVMVRSETGESIWGFVDITELKHAEAQIRQLAFHDPLTGLPNRRLLYDRLERTLAASRRSGRHAALMVLDLDRFKPLNDAHGHAVGDLLLVEVGQRLKHCVRAVDTVARFGGDEFVVMLDELDRDRAAALAHARQVAEKIRAALAEPYFLTPPSGDAARRTTVEHHCSASIGGVVFRDPPGGQDEILRRADAAMYEAKAAGRNQVCLHEAGATGPVAPPRPPPAAGPAGAG